MWWRYTCFLYKYPNKFYNLIFKVKLTKPILIVNYYEYTTKYYKIKYIFTYKYYIYNYSQYKNRIIYYFSLIKKNKVKKIYQNITIFLLFLIIVHIHISLNIYKISYPLQLFFSTKNIFLVQIKFYYFFDMHSKTEHNNFLFDKKSQIVPPYFFTKKTKCFSCAYL